MPGGGSATRTNLCFTCLGRIKANWRSVVDVNLVGYLDAPGKVTVPSRSQMCGPPN